MPAWSFPHRTMLAPMEGVSHAVFRNAIAEKGGVDIVCTEFVRISRAPLSAKALRREVQRTPHALLSVQVMGRDAVKMAEASRVMKDAGADIVDINLGCPMPRVVRGGVGAAMLKDPELLEQVLSAMREATPGVLLSAKIRAGWDDAASVVRNARIAENCGVDILIVHPRRRCDFYQGVADWRIIRTLVSELSIPVVGNGDVWYASDANRMERETGCAAVMIGRPAIRNPFIFQQLAALRRGDAPIVPTGRDLLEHIESLAERYEPAFPKGITGKMKELTRWALRAVGDADLTRRALRAPDAAALLEVLRDELPSLPASKLDLGAEPTLALESSGSAIPAAVASELSPL